MKDSKEMLNRTAERQEMRTHFAVDARGIDLLSRLLIALPQVCRVNYGQLALALNAKVKISSNVKRLQRFFKEFSFSHRAYVQFIWKQFASGKTVLAIDRTDWKFGRHHINVLMIGVAYQGTAIPLMWKLLGKAGNSSQRERIWCTKPNVLRMHTASLLPKIYVYCASHERYSACRFT